MQYVGELCRYLLNAPESPLDKQNNVQMAWGNGMRPDVWETFRQRFGIPIINELYAATDGMGSMYNENHGEFSRGALARRGLIWHLINGKREVRVKMDVDTEEMMRDKDGFAIKCRPGEVPPRYLAVGLASLREVVEADVVSGEDHQSTRRRPSLILSSIRSEISLRELPMKILLLQMRVFLLLLLLSIANMLHPTIG